MAKTKTSEGSVVIKTLRGFEHYVLTERTDCEKLRIYDSTYDAICLVAEVGEVLDVIKKVERDHDFPEESREDLLLECGDVLHYLVHLLDDIGCDLEDAAEANVEKLENRKKYGKGKHGKRS